LPETLTDGKSTTLRAVKRYAGDTLLSTNLVVNTLWQQQPCRQHPVSLTLILTTTTIYVDQILTQ